MGFRVPTQHSYTEITDSSGNRYVGQTSSQQAQDRIANIGPDMANSFMDSYERNAPSGPSAEDYANIFGCLITLAIKIIGAYFNLWKKSKLAGFIVTLLIVFYVVFANYQQTIINYFNNFDFTMPQVTLPSFPAIAGFFEKSPTPRVVISPTPDPVKVIVPSANQPSFGETPWQPCAGLKMSNLRPGMIAMVSKSARSIKIRKSPGTNSEMIGGLKTGDHVKILDDQPGCSNGYVWWHINLTSNNFSGWVAEGNSQSYWLEPVK